MNKHTAMDTAGRVHKRNSKDRLYSHCVVAICNDRSNSPGSTIARWASSLRLAEKQASGLRMSAWIDCVEVIPTTVTVSVPREQRSYPDPDGRDFDNLGESPDY